MTFEKGCIGLASHPGGSREAPSHVMLSSDRNEPYGLVQSSGLEAIHYLLDWTTSARLSPCTIPALL